MARRFPQPDRLYSAQEVAEFFGLGEKRNVMAQVNRGDFPTPLQQTREAEPQWEGSVLLDWLRVRPRLLRPGKKYSENFDDEPEPTGSEPERTRTNRKRTGTNSNEPAQDE
jgi:hypothetical protein